MKTKNITTGGCYCGAVRYKIKGSLCDVVNCHCTQCRQLNGNFGSHSKALKTNITITKDKGLKWYKISDVAKRGFCGKCGSGLFWQLYQLDATGIIAGSLDTSTNLKTIGHLFVAHKADFYEITDDLPQYQQSSNGELVNDY